MNMVNPVIKVPDIDPLAEEAETNQEKNEKKRDKVEQKALFRRVDWEAEERRIDAMSEEEVAQPENLERARKMIEAGVTADINQALKQLKFIQLKEAQLRAKKVDKHDPRYIQLLQEEGRMEDVAKALEEIRQKELLRKSLDGLVAQKSPETTKIEGKEGEFSTREAAQDAPVLDFDVSGLLGEETRETPTAKKEAEKPAEGGVAEQAKDSEENPEQPATDKNEADESETPEPETPEEPAAEKNEPNPENETAPTRRSGIEVYAQLQKALPEQHQHLLRDNSFHLIFENRAFLALAKKPDMVGVVEDYTGRFDNRGFPIRTDGSTAEHRASEYLSNSDIRNVAEATLKRYQNIYPERVLEAQPLPDDMPEFSNENSWMNGGEYTSPTPEEERTAREELLRKFDAEAPKNIDTKQSFTFGAAAPQKLEPGREYRIQAPNGDEATLFVVGFDSTQNHLITADASKTTLSVWTPELFDKYFTGDDKGMTLEKIPSEREKKHAEREQRVSDLLSQADAAIESGKQGNLYTAKESLEQFLDDPKSAYPTTRQKIEIQKRVDALNQLLPPEESVIVDPSLFEQTESPLSDQIGQNQSKPTLRSRVQSRTQEAVLAASLRFGSADSQQLQGREKNYIQSSPQDTETGSSVSYEAATNNLDKPEKDEKPQNKKRNRTRNRNLTTKEKAMKNSKRRRRRRRKKKENQENHPQQSAE